MSTKKTEPKSVNAATAETTAITTLGQNDIPKMLDMVTKQINELKGNLPDKSETKDKELPGVGKIKNLTTVDALLKAASVVMAKEKAYKEAVKEIIPAGIKAPPFKLNGIGSKAWLDDIKARVGIVANKEQLAKLEKVKKKLEENLSAEAKLARDLEEIQGILTLDVE